jgi:quercetin dioxygenase-like cupin family protein
MIVRNQSGERKDAGQGVARKILARGGELMMVQVFFEKGAVGAVHGHPHQQVSYVVSGAFELEMDGVKDIVRDGDTFYVPSSVPHGVVALERSVILDIFTPQRQDFLK